MRRQYPIAFALASLFIHVAQAEIVFESDCGQRVESFAYFVDYSGTMMLSPEEDAPRDRQKEEKQETVSKTDLAEETKGLMTPEVFEKTPRIQSIKLLLKEINLKFPRKRALTRSARDREPEYFVTYHQYPGID